MLLSGSTHHHTYVPSDGAPRVGPNNSYSDPRKVIGEDPNPEKRHIGSARLIASEERTVDELAWAPPQVMPPGPIPSKARSDGLRQPTLSDLTVEVVGRQLTLGYF